MINRRSRRSRVAASLTGICAAVVLAGTTALTGSTAVADTADDPSYSNAISDSFSDTFADPAVIQGKDGWWYAYSTADPLKSGEPSGIMHIARTKDWQTWEYRGTVFNETNRPVWAAENSFLWAPDVRYIQGRYVMYYTVMDTLANPGEDPAIGVATATDPGGPWTPTDEPIIAPRKAGDGFLGTIDPAGFTDVDGQNYLYFGGYNGGNWATKVSPDGLTATGDYTQVGIDNRYEGSFVVRHEGWYSLMASSANCCAGPATGYSVFAGRSRSPLGPFKDRDGIAMTDSVVGGSLVITQNGNRWIGAGHHAVITDNSGRDFMVYHAIDRNKPWLNDPFGINRRPMLADRIDWINGWPRVRAGAGPSATEQPSPVTGSALGITADDPAAGGFSGLQAGPEDAQSGKTALVQGNAKTGDQAPGGRLRVRLDLKSQQALTIGLGSWPKKAVVKVDPAGGDLKVITNVGNSSKSETATLPEDPEGWRTLVLEFDGASVSAEVSSSDLSDPQAEVRYDHEGFSLDSAPVELAGLGVQVDNVSVQPLARQAVREVPTPQAGRRIAGDEFNRGLGEGWNWVREDSDAQVSGGSLEWPLQSSDLVGSTNDAGVLLHDTPDGTWIAETKLHLDLGANEVRNYQQAGLMAYASDDDFARLSSVSIWNTRQTEFGRELVEPDAGRTAFGGAMIGTPAPTLWMRLAHRTNADGEHLYRAGTSRDGRHWTWGAVWTLGADTDPRIGLFAQGGDTPATTASFDYLRFYASDWAGDDQG